MTREEAIQHFKEQLDIFGGEHAEAIKVAIEALSEETPTIQEKHQLSEETSTNTSTKSTNISTDTPADRPRGEWIVRFDGNEQFCFCSVCKEQWYEDDLYMGGNEFPNFCPNCGAYMRGDMK